MSKHVVTRRTVLGEGHALLFYLCIDVNSSTNKLLMDFFLAQITCISTLLEAVSYFKLRECIETL